MHDDPNNTSQPPQHFYAQNTIPAQFVHPSLQQSTPSKKDPWNWYKQQKKGIKIGVGCGTLFLALLLCMCSLTAIGGNHQASTPVAQTGQSVATQAVQKPNTSEPTPTPTVMPTVTPTPTPVPTAAPTLPPTHPPAPLTQPTHPPAPRTQPARPPAPQQPPAPVGVNGNPWGYNFSPGNFIYDPPADFCDYFNCIASFGRNTSGYVDECNDETFSHSGGRPGACSRHGGEMRPLYSH